MSARRPLVVANWKLNGDFTLVEQMSTALNQVSDIKAKIVICPSYPFLSALSGCAVRYSVGAQNVSQHRSGAFTGEVSAVMLNSCGVKYVIVGHSERRALYAESDDIIAAKFAEAVAQGLKPILCIGESLEQRESGTTEQIIASQLKAVIESVGIDAFADAVVAYEPVWAIGTGKTATAEMAQQVHRFIRQLIAGYDLTIAKNICLLYGGSVNSSNSKALFAESDIDGGLVGGASLNTEEFLAICQSV